MATFVRLLIRGFLSLFFLGIYFSYLASVWPFFGGVDDKGINFFGLQDLVIKLVTLSLSLSAVAAILSSHIKSIKSDLISAAKGLAFSGVLLIPYLIAVSGVEFWIPQAHAGIFNFIIFFSTILSFVAVISGIAIFTWHVSHLIVILGESWFRE